MNKPPAGNNQEPRTGASFSGGDLGVHLLVCVLVTGALGYALDMWAGSRPWGMLGGGFLGFFAWLWEVWRAMKR